MDALTELNAILMRTPGVPSTGQLTGESCVDGTRARGGGVTRLVEVGENLTNLPVDPTDALFNAAAPSVEIIHEKLEHRLIVFLKSEGCSNREISRRTGYTEAWISQLTRQRWFQERVVHELQLQGRESVRGLLATSATDSVIKLITLRDDPKTPAAVQVNCANSLLDRYLGKATQTIVNQHDVQEKVVSAQTALEELEALRREELLLTQKLEDVGA